MIIATHYFENLSLDDISAQLLELGVDFNPLVDLRHTCAEIGSKHFQAWLDAHQMLVCGLEGYVAVPKLLEMVIASGCTPVIINSVNVLDGVILISKRSS